MTTNKSLAESLPAVDMALMIQSEKDIRSAYNKITSTNYPELEGICKRIYENTSQTLNDAQRFNIGIRAEIDTLTAQLSRLNDRIIRLEGQLENANPEEEEDILTDIQQLRVSGDKFINEHLQTPIDDAASLNLAVGNIEFYDFKQNLADEAAELEGKLESTQGYIDEYTDKYNKAQEEWDALD